MIEQNATTSAAALIAAVLAWWAEQECDTVSVDAGDGYGEEYNVYDAPPPFVQIAQALAESSGPAQPVEAVDERTAIEALREIVRIHDNVRSPRQAERIADIARAALAHPRPTGDGMVSVVAEDANNYCRILTALGMEEEGDPVAEVEKLIAAAYDQGNADAGVISTTAPTGEQAGEVVPYAAEVVAEVVRGDDGQNKLSFVIEGAEAALEVGETLYMIAGLPMPDDGAIDVYLAKPRPVGVPDGLAKDAARYRWWRDHIEDVAEDGDGVRGIAYAMQLPIAMDPSASFGEVADAVADAEIAAALGVEVDRG